MFQTALGRIHSTIIVPPQTLDMKVYIDAGGKADHTRVWGGIAVIGDSELNWIQKIVDDMYKDNPRVNDKDFQLKGWKLETSTIISAGKRLYTENRRILFWSNWYPEWSNQDSLGISEILLQTLNNLKANKDNLHQNHINDWYQENAKYFSNLNEINRHKVLSIIAHLHWLFNEIARVNIGNQLKSVEITIDRENFPNEARCGILIKSFIAASLQTVGMACSITGSAYKEKADEGAVVINVCGKSKESSGLTYVDILLQAVLRKVEPHS